MEHTATYSPEDNKLRLYPACRLPKEEYERVRAAGFIWAPKQELFVAPTWTPQREDFLLELCEEIGDEDTSILDRAEAKQERLEDLAERKGEEAERARAAVHAIADNIPFGQPILVGHHSEKRARKDAERIQNGMHKAVNAWKAAEYWTGKAKDPVHFAKFKTRPDVRYRRLKGLESDRRKLDASMVTARNMLKLWAMDPLTWAFAKHITGDYRCNVSRCFPIADYPRKPGASTYEGSMSLWGALGDDMDTGIITPEQAREIAVKSFTASLDSAGPWLEHTENRIAYERAMLDDAGGLVGEQEEIKVGGRVLSGGEWNRVIRINKKDGRICSVRTAKKGYGSLVSLEDIKGYEAPTEEEAQATAEATKKGPLCNYPGPRFATCTQAQWDAIYKESRGHRVVNATDTTGAHRVRIAIGYKLQLPPKEGKELDPHYCEANRTHHYWPVFITDAKRKDPPQKTPTPATEDAAGILDSQPHLPSFLQRYKVTSLDHLTVHHFEKNDAGNIRAGMKWTHRDDGPIEHECYQFDTLAEVQETARAYEKPETGVCSYKIVTHTGEYKNMRTIYAWDRRRAERKKAKQ